MQITLSRQLLTLGIAALLSLNLHAQTRETRVPDAAVKIADQLREKALKDNRAWEITESLTTEVGPRLPGTEADARAVEWAKAKFKELGFDKVWTQPVTFPKWERRSESAAVTGKYAQPLVITALGGSPGGTVEAEIVRFDSLDALEKAAAGSLKGKIAFVDVSMQRDQGGNGYSVTGKVRSRGPSAAVRAGASAFLMRSAGTSNNRVAHTGITRFDDGLTPIPLAALATPDADQLTRLLKRGAITVKLNLDCGWNGEYTSHNVIGEFRGRKLPDQVVVMGGHLDSWDHGTGAVDDAAGIGISMAAAKIISELPKRPDRTIRVIAFANEEQGLYGGKEYARLNKDKIKQHTIVSESDFGAGRIYQFDAGVADYARPAVEQIAKALAPLNIQYKPGEGRPESDISVIANDGAAWGYLGHDGTEYFDLHHNANDTLDKIDPAALAQNTAAYTVFAYMAAQADGEFGSALKATTDSK